MISDAKGFFSNINCLQFTKIIKQNKFLSTHLSLTSPSAKRLFIDFWQQHPKSLEIFLTILKIINYCTIIIPLVAFLSHYLWQFYCLYKSEKASFNISRSPQSYNQMLF
ncbi:hypothetical protein CLAVI_000891 [Candidatus Clavichlamydia salmonicola]|nr:hypothetical protein [Candidatus Clavichlamydia salmonicola]